MDQIDQRYRIAKEIGRGGMGTVYLGHDDVLDRDVAIKVVNDPNLDEMGKDRVLREARLAGQLNHPNIVSIHDAGETDGIAYIVMEFVEGIPIYDDPPKAMDEILGVAAQLCEALMHAHEHGVVHRDLKPENILITGDGKVKLTDFGLATSAASRISTDGEVAGTVYYLAPEILKGEGADHRADLYSLGVLLYEWCTGQLPFIADDPMAVITQHLFMPAVPPRAKAAHVPDAMDQLILRLLNKAPEDRPATAGEVLEILRSPGAQKIELEAAPRAPALEWIGRGRMTGRELELQQARSLWTKASRGKSQGLLISGEAGIGKTRLLHELFAFAKVTRAIVLNGPNDAQAGQPFGAFKSLLRSALEGNVDILNSLPERVVSDVLILVPEYQDRISGTFPRPSMETDYEQLRLFESISLFLARLSQKSPLLLSIEDAQWADSGTLYLLRYLIQHTTDWPVLFVLTYRDIELPDTQVLQEVLLDLQRQHLSISMALKRLTKEETESMLATFLGGQLSPELAEEIYGVTEGNPFFIEEVCKGMVANERLVFEGDHLRTIGRQTIEIPSNVRVAVQTQMQAIPDKTRRLLEAAAVRGRDFEVDVIEMIQRLEGIEITEALRNAIRAQIIQEVPTENGRRFRFTHTLIPAAMRDGMPAKRQKTLHARLAPVLEATSPEDYEALAHHYGRAGQAEKAIHFLLMAGERAYSLYTCREAIQSFLEASTLQKRRNDNDAAARTLLRLGLAYSADFQFDRAQNTYEEAFELWDQVWQKEAKGKSFEPGESLCFAVEEPLTLDPGRVNDDASSFLVGQIFEGLVEIDAASGIIPALASRWDVSEDGKRYTFHLRQRRNWNDGQPITAGDFEYAWKRNLSLGSESPAALLLNVVENARSFAEGKVDVDSLGIKAVDNLTLEVRLETPAAYFPQLLTHAVTYPLPRWAIEGDRKPWASGENFVSNGPYQLAKWSLGDTIRLAFNHSYRGLFPGNVGSIEAPIISQYDLMIDEFDRDALDGVSLVNADPSTISKLKTAYSQEFRFTSLLSTLYLAFRTDLPPLDDSRFRKALIQAIDRSALIRETGSIHYEPALGGFLPPGISGHSPNIGLGSDKEAARRFLAEAMDQKHGKPPSVELLYTGDPEGNPVATYLRQRWIEVLGIEVVVQGLPWNEFIDRIDHDPPHIAINGWTADYQDPDNMLRIPFHSSEGLNRIGWHNVDFDVLTEEAAQITDRKKRIELYRAADRILVEEEAAVMPLGYAQGRQLIKPHVQIPRSPPAFTRLKNAKVNASSKKGPSALKSGGK